LLLISMDNGIPFTTAQKAADKIRAAKDSPDTEIGNVVGISTMFAEGYLVELEKRQLELNTDFDGLADEELLAIHVYSAMEGFYSKMNAVLLGADNFDEANRTKYRATIDICKRGLARLPDYPKTAWPTYRFEDGSKYSWEEQFVAGRIFQNKIFWSTGRTSGFDAIGIARPRLEITVYGKKAGKDIAKMAASKTEGGGEILFPPGTSFKTLAVELEKDLDPKQKKLVTNAVYIVVEEVG
jgi:hypothetical protein